MKLNPNAVVFWAFSGVAGYLVAGWEGVVWGLAISLGISLLVSSSGR